MPQTPENRDRIPQGHQAPGISMASESLLPSSLHRELSRRQVLKGAVLGSAGLAAAAVLGCGSTKGAGAETSPEITSGIPPTPSPEPTSTPEPSPTSESSPTPEAKKEPTTLREAADRIGFRIGVGVGGYGFPEHYRQLTEIQKREFNLGFIFLGWSFMEPQQGNINYGPLSGDVNLVVQSGMDTFAGPLIWGDSVPQWIRQGNYSRSELIDIMRRRITDIMQRGKGRIKSYKVVNEAYTPNDIFNKIIGSDYVEIAFQTAREVDPSAQLVYNDFDNHTTLGPRSSRLESTRTIVEKLKARGLIDKVGLEMIIPYPQVPPKESVIEAMRSYGIPVIVTEFGVNIKNLQGTQEERFNRQAEIYRDMLSAAIESGVCKDFIVFQVVDKIATWEISQTIPGASPDNDPTPFDDNFQPKPAYFSMLDVLKKPPK